jgi:hypothetical protein
LAGEYYRWWVLFKECLSIWQETRKESVLERYALEKLGRLRDEVASRLPQLSAAGNAIDDPTLAARLAQTAQEWGQFVADLERSWRTLGHIEGLKVLPRLQGLWHTLSHTAAEMEGRAGQVGQQIWQDVRNETGRALQRTVDECEVVGERLQALRQRSLLRETKRALQFIRCLVRKEWSLEVLPLHTEQASQ